MSDHDRQAVVATLRRHSAEGRMDVDELTSRTARAAAATSRDDLSAALGEFGPLPGSTARRRVMRTPVVVAAVLLATVAAVAVVAAVTPFAFGFHPAFFWVVPLIGFKLARFQHHRDRYPHRPSDDTVSV
ncbi:MAG: DUF1707 domain-containing protein [Acidimicrobiales bacterium]